MFFGFAPIGKVEKTRFEQNYTTFVNPALCAAWKSPPKMVLWNRNSKIRFPGCFFVSPRWGKSKKRVLNKIIRPSSTRLYALLGKAHPKWWYETEIVTLDSQGVFSLRPEGESRKNAFWTKLYDLRQPGFMAQLRVGLTKQRKKPGSRRSTNCVQNAFFQLSPSGRNGKTPLGSNFIISVSCHHFRWAFPSSGKSRVYEGRPISFKTRFFNFSHRGETKKNPRDRILQFRFHGTISGGLFQAAEKAGFTKVVEFRSKRVFQFSPSGRNEKTPLGSNFTSSVSWHNFWWAFPSSGKSRVDEGRRIAFETRFFNFPHRGETEKHPWDRIL